MKQQLSRRAPGHQTGLAGPQPKAGHAAVIESSLAGGPLHAQALLELQRLAGNQSVGLLVQRRPAGTITAPPLKRPPAAKAPAKKAPAAPPGPTAKWKGEVGPNAGPEETGKMLRIPVEGLPEGRAIVLVPTWIGREPKEVEVLVHLHGFGVGYRQLTKTLIKKGERTSGMTEGQVRDLAVDKTEAQIEASGRDVVGILPQAAGSQSEFGNFTTDSYVKHVFAALTSLKVWDKLPQIRGVVLSGHSGAGNVLTPMLDKSERLPEKLEEVILFDALNWDYQVGHVWHWLERQLARDLHELVGLPTRAKRLEYLTRSLRFRGYHTHTGNYPKRYQKVDEAIGGWFSRHSTLLGILAVESELKSNYVVIDAGDIPHEQVMGEKERFKESLGALGPVVAAPAPPASAADEQKEAAATTTRLDKALSGLHWVSEFAGDTTTDKLKDPFKTHVEAFIALLEANGATVEVNATFRRIERASLMHWASWIAYGKIKPSQAEDDQKTGIIWDHGDDAKSLKAATDMCSKAGYDIAYPAALNSNHTAGLAIDMTITGLPKIIKGLPGKKSVDIGTDPPETNSKLHDLAWTYYRVKKHKTDRPHWSVNGR
jgi:hypothetical protein